MPLGNSSARKSAPSFSVLDRTIAQCYAAQDAPAGSIRDHPADSTVGRSLDRQGASGLRTVSFLEQGIQVTAFVRPAVRAHRGQLGEINWFGCISLWHPHHATDEGNTDLPSDN